MHRWVALGLAGGCALVAAAFAFGGTHHGAALPQPPAHPDALTAVGARSADRPTQSARAATWCGTTSTTDRPNAVAGYPVHVLYVYPADGSDQSATVAPQIQGWIDEDVAWWQREDPYHVPRFDMYSAPCGLQVDLQVYHSTTLSVATNNASTAFNQFWNEINTWPGAGWTKYLVFVDQVNTGNTCGEGGPADGSTIGSLSMGLAMVFLSAAQCNGASRSSVAAHEFTHSISPDTGFPNAPHACPGDVFHVCDSSGDLMYPYVENGIPLNSLQLDVGHDDYYGDHAPYDLAAQPWLREIQQQQHLALTLTGQGSVTSDVPGVSCTATCGSDWDAGSQVTLTATPADGQRFVRWTGACADTSNACQVTLNGATSVTAQFAPATFGLTVSVSGTGSVKSLPRGISCSRATCAAQFPSFTQVYLTASAPKGWQFARWTGSCSGAKAKCTLPMSAAATVHASFVKAKPKKKR